MVRRAAQATKRGSKGLPRNAGGRKIFDAACRGDDKELKKLLRKYSDRVKYLLEERVNGQTALMAACAKGLTKCARLLMETPTAVVAEDEKGKNTLTFSGIPRPRRLRLGIIYLWRGDGECR